MPDLHNFEELNYVPAKIVRRKKSFTIQKLYTIVLLTIKAIIYFFIGVVLSFNDFFLKKKIKKSISGQLALITGGGNGLGKCISLELAKLGCNIAVIDIDIKGAERTVKDAKMYGVNAKAYKVDISDFTAVQELHSQIEKDLGNVDILINNAALLLLLTLNEGTPEDIERIVKVNITSHFWTTRVFIKGMIERKHGHIVAIASIAALEALGKSIAYTTTKYAVRGFMDALHEDLLIDDLHKDIHLTTIFPYFMASQQQLVNDIQKKFGDVELLSIEKVEKLIISGILQNCKYVIIPNYFNVLLWLLSICPRPMREQYQELFKPRKL